jgi:hypothetical protein
MEKGREYFMLKDVIAGEMPTSVLSEANSICLM